MNNFITKKQSDILRKNLGICGIEASLRQTQEECSELAVAISHYIRKDKRNKEELLEEFTDLIISMEQMFMTMENNGIELYELLGHIDKGINKVINKELNNAYT